MSRPPHRSVSPSALRSARPDAELASIAALVARATRASTAMVVLVDEVHRVFAGSVGLPSDVPTCEALPIWAFWRRIVESGSALATDGLAGVPVSNHGTIGGAVCVAGASTRRFADDDLATLALAARLAEVRLPGILRENPPPLMIRPGGGPRLAIGDVVDDKYEIMGALGEGGEATVYLASDRRVGLPVALKVQHPSVDPTILREAKALAALHHPSIVQLYGWGQLPSGSVYLVLERIDGVTLHSYLAELHRADERLPIPRLLETTRALAGALATLHAAGRLHGDVQPANIMIDRILDRPVLIDFGLGTKIDGTARARGGTPGWSAPEQLDLERGALATPALDAYGLACVAYDMLAGSPPFRGAREALIPAQLAGAAPPVRTFRSELPESVDDVFARALSADPRARFPSALAFAEALDSACEPRASLAAVVVAGASPPRSHAQAFVNARAGVGRVIGKTAEAKLFASLPAELRAAFDAAEASHMPQPTVHYVEYLEAYSQGNLARIELLGRMVTGLTVPETFRQMHVAHTPEALLHVAGEMLHRYHDWGEIRATRTSPHSVALEMEMPQRFAPTMCHFLIAVLGALIKSMGRTPTIAKTGCIAEGGAACCYDIRWT